MSAVKKYLPWTFRILVFLLFGLSAVAKMFPIWAFEKQLVDLGIADWCMAPFWARLIIATELTLGIGILQPHFLRKIIIPATTLLLTVFSIHLTMEMVKHGPMNGNCGCFGQLIPMTPLEAFIKNIVTIGLLIYLYRNVQDREKGQNRISPLIMLFLGSALLMFAAFPFCPCVAEEEPLPIVSADSLNVDSTQVGLDSNLALTDTVTADTSSKVALNPTAKKDTAKSKSTPVVPKADPGPKPVVSKYAKYTNFSGKSVNLDEGKKILCLFAPGCDHCRATAKEICALSKQMSLPEINILFMDEEAEVIPEFFKEAGCTYPYQVLKIVEFWRLMGADANTPGVVYLWNGNVVKFYEGLEGNKFDVEGLKKALSLAGNALP